MTVVLWISWGVVMAAWLLIYVVNQRLLRALRESGEVMRSTTQLLEELRAIADEAAAEGAWPWNIIEKVELDEELPS